LKSSSKFTTRMLAWGLALGLSVTVSEHMVAQDDIQGSPPSQQAASQETQQPGREALLKARQALALGDVPTAKQYLAEAQEHADASSDFDSPDQLTAMLERHGQLVEMARSGDADQYNQKAAEFFLEQARSLMKYRDLATAESLILQAKQFPADFSDREVTPDSLLGALQQQKGHAAVSGSNQEVAKSAADRLLSQAQLAFDQKDYDQAARLVAEVKAMDLPASAFSDSVIVPWELDLQIRNAQSRTSGFASEVATESDRTNESVAQAVYDPERDATRNQPAGHTANDDSSSVMNSRGQELYESGVHALEQRDDDRALEYFRLAWQYEDQLDDATRSKLRDQLQALQASAPQRADLAGGFEAIDDVDQVMRQKFQSEVIRARATAERMMEDGDPRGARSHMESLREKVASSPLDDASKRQLLNAVEREIADMNSYIEQNRAQIETDELNQSRIGEVEEMRSRRYQVEQEVAKLVDEFERLKHEERYPEAMQVARQARQLAPEMEVVQAMYEKAQLVYNLELQRDLKEAKADYFLEGLNDADRAAIGGATFVEPIRWGSENEWADLSKRRLEALESSRYRSESERQIYSLLRNQKVQFTFTRTPLAEALDVLAERIGVNVVIDNRALQLENVAQDAPVDMVINNPISAGSALNIILGNLNLVYVVEDEVVKVTSKEVQQSEKKEKVYYVGDLVVPIQNFQTSLNSTFISPYGQANAWGRQNMGGLNGSDMYAQTGGGGVTQAGLAPALEAAQTGGSPVAMGQQIPNGLGGNLGMGRLGMGGSPQAGMPFQQQIGPPSIGNPGGITEADFDDLIELIQETIDPDSWEENGGTGRLRPFASNLSLVVTATQEVQDQIQDLLTRLRQLNDVQIVIEVRFITLNDDFFERLGIDFDFKLEDGSNLTPPGGDSFTQAGSVGGGFSSSSIVGRDADSENQNITGDLDLLFSQNSFGATIPQFGNFNAGNGANFGFAILSDIEVYFLINAAKGDSRTNVVLAPTVTMFNGQSATVSDFSQNPFVTGIIPIVGDFAAAQQPIISLLPEGTQLNVQAVASSDRRFVRMTMVPFFSRIESVSEFTFEGSTSQRRDTRTDIGDLVDSLTPDNAPKLGRGEEVEIIQEGTTVQLPVLAITNVSTTVSVPDGGTVLLGGIKSQSEGRTEAGVPMLSNIPYLNRLFKNVSIGRETQSLMMMVTPKIIITEEEELEQTGINSQAGR